MPKDPTDTPPEPSVQAIVHELNDLVKFALECENRENGSIASFAQANMQLAHIRKMLSDLDEAYKTTMQELGISEKDVASYRKKIEESTQPEKKLLSAIQGLIQVCEESRERLYQSLQENRQTLKQIEQENKPSKKTKSGRKDKFKGVGGKKKLDAHLKSQFTRIIFSDIIVFFNEGTV